MTTIVAEPLTADAFAPYGDVLVAPRDPGRDYFDGALANGRAGARPSLSLTHVMPHAGLPLTATQMERHEFSSQSFVPIEVARYFVIVAPKGSDGSPDTSRVRAFVAGPDQGVTFRSDTWHHPMTVLDRPARFAVIMWLDGSAADTEFITLAQPFSVTVRD
jgi:ureidoglycolate lyase